MDQEVGKEWNWVVGKMMEVEVRLEEIENVKSKYSKIKDHNQKIQRVSEI